MWACVSALRVWSVAALRARAAYEGYVCINKYGVQYNRISMCLVRDELCSPDPIAIALRLST